MSLTNDDMQNLRLMVREEVRSIVSSELKPISTKLDSVDGRIQALENDIHDIYLMLAKREAGSPSFNKLSLDQKILETYKQLQITAKEAGVTLPH